MKLSLMIPDEVKNWVKLIQLRRKFPDRRIYTPYIGKGVRLGVECLVSRGVEIAAGVEIGDYSYVNVGTVIASGKIGKFCSIGYFCQIGMPDHPLEYVSTSPRTYGSRNVFGVPAFWDDYHQIPIIENDVWIGSKALLMQGVHIGNGAVIAAAAVVTKDVDPYTIVAGVPAKPVRKRFDDATIEHLLQLRWWDMPLHELHTLKDLFLSQDQARFRMEEVMQFRSSEIKN
jgi:acetyltransferase-like isoleucine patch superfamily enzyme